MESVSRRKVLLAGAGLLPLGGMAALGAAVPAPVGPAGEDPLLASHMLIAGNKQIQVCQFALGRTQNGDVRAFAQAEIEEHQNIERQLAKLGFRYPIAAQTAGPQGVAAIEQPGLLPGAAPGIVIEHQVHQQCITTSKDELGELQGAMFDKRFINSQLDAHYSLFDHAVVFRQHATPALAPVLDLGRPIIERHIALCKTLLAALDQRS